MKWLPLILLLLTSCVKTEEINAPIPRDIDTLTKAEKQMELPINTTSIDTTRVPIGFVPSVEEWEENK